MLPVFRQEVRAVARKGWAVLGGALLTAVGLVSSAIHKHWPSSLWWLPLLLGVIIAEALVIAERRRERDELLIKLDSVRDRLALDSIKVRYERTENGPPSVHDFEFRLYFHNTADLPLRWKISEVSAADVPAVATYGLGTGTLAPDKVVYYSVGMRVTGADEAQIPPPALRIRFCVEYGVAEPRFRWRFGVVVHDFPASPSREWADADFLHVEDSREELA